MIRKPDTDDRNYRFITLENKLDVLLIEDKKSEKASAALDVHVGHLNDPVGIDGLAHFCEHLLFMGTEKYPTENDYNDYLSKHSGYSNAYTSAEHTNYYFSVGSDFLEGALDRFAQFFISPLFSEGSTERELNAVDSEHKKNLQSDGWRMHQLDKDLSNPSHPYTKFGTGNIETLKENPAKLEIDVRSELLKFHDMYYSSNIMKLVILGKEPLDTLEEWAVSKFTNVANKNIPIPSSLFTGHPLSENELGKFIFVKPVKDLRRLDLTWKFPDTGADEYKLTKPSRYLSHLIGHESEGSILSYLKKNGWAVSLSGGDARGGINFGFFKVSINLTEEGEAHYEDIIVSVFRYIKMMSNVGVQEWVFKECQSLAELDFRFAEKVEPASTCSRLAAQLHHYGGENVLSGVYLIEKFDPQQIRLVDFHIAMIPINGRLFSDFLNHLSVTNFRVMFSSQEFEKLGIATEGEWLKARFYGTEYKVADFSDSLKKRLNSLTLANDFHLPLKNDFIPERFDVRKLDTQSPFVDATMVEDTPLMRVWYRKDDTFYTPKVYIYLKLSSPLVYATPANSVKSNLYIELVKDSLNEFSYMAEVAGLYYSLSDDTNGFQLVVGGYNDKISVLLQKFVEKMKTLVIDENRFKYIKEQLIRNYKNINMEAPNSLALYYGSALLQEKMWTYDDKRAEIDAITHEDVQSFFPTIIKQLFAEGLVYGNVEAEDAVKLMKIVENTFNSTSLPISARGQFVRTHLIPQGQTYAVNLEVPNPDNLNSAIEYYIQEQLGYLVHSGTRINTRVIGYRVIIQSERNPTYLESRIEDFLKNMKQTIVNLTELEFDKHKQSVIIRLLEKDKNLWDASQRLWSHISSKYCFFNQHLVDSEYIKTITKEAVLEFYEKFIDPKESNGRRMIVNMRRNGTEIERVSKNGRIEIDSVEQIFEAKSGLLLGKGPKMVDIKKDLVSKL
ncbi:Insulinase (Peptidase M16) [Nowakowskiella sp. JEL0407]|nr:Insulinase (Peptidase M16) [Nowakowskiella sp. JEL0407]